jgi:Ca2+-binding EF-hand superfamily protein
VSTLFRLILAVSLNGLLAAPFFFVTVTAQAKDASPIAAYDVDKDGTLDLVEVKAAAAAAFDRLDRDHDGSLDPKELRSQLSPDEFAAADTDHDGTVSKEEYLALAERLFKEADTDHDGTLSKGLVRSNAGRTLLRLLK